MTCAASMPEAARSLASASSSSCATLAPMEQRPIELAKDGAAHLLAECDAALEAGEIDEAEWHRRVAAVITPAYLAAETPWGQSGKSGDADSWERARSLLVEAMRPGAFLDVGCASGYLMECMAQGSAAGVSHRVDRSIAPRRRHRLVTQCAACRCVA
jgi:hypothetical protein